MRRLRAGVVCSGPALLLVWLCAEMAAAQQYSSADEAYRNGARFINDGNLAAARAPLEAALELAPDDASRIRVNRALLIPYRELPDIEPMQRAAEYIITHSEQAAERSLTCRTLLTFIHRRGKLDAAIKGYEDRLKAAPEDRTTLFILTEAYANLKKNPRRSAELAERLAAVEKKLGKDRDPAAQAQLAQQYVRSGKLKEGAALYEQLAPGDPKLAAWHYKEAAAAWLKAGEKNKALAAARKSDAAAPEQRNKSLTYFWHKGLADVYLDAGAPKDAVPHYEAAIESTDIEGYLKDCRDRLAKARAAAKE